MTEMKRCSRGDDCVHEMGCWQPANNNHFGNNRSTFDGFQSYCKACRKARRQEDREKITQKNKRYYEQNKQEILKKQRGYYSENAERIKLRVKQYQEINSEKISQRKKRKYRENHEERVNQIREYYNNNKDVINHSRRLKYKENVEEMRGKQRVNSRRFRKKNPEHIKRYVRRWKQDNPDKIRKYYTKGNAKRRAQKANLPSTFTDKQWERCLKYFDYTCPVCGVRQNLFIRLQREHVEPLSHKDSAGDVATNIIPLCGNRLGLESHLACNQSKGNKSMYEWLISRFGEQKADEVMMRVEGYFEWVREQDKV